MNVSSGTKCVGFQMEIGARKAVKKEKRLILKTSACEGNNRGEIKTCFEEKDVMKITFRIPFQYEMGYYSIRLTDNQRSENISFKIEPNLNKFNVKIKKDMGIIPEAIKTPPPSIKKVRSSRGIGENENTDLWLMDGSNFKILSRLTDTGDCGEASWSPDGKTIAYVRWINDNSQLWTLSVEKNQVNSKPVRFMEHFSDSTVNPIWSHTGEYLAFLSGNRVWVVGKNGLNPKQIATVENIQHILAWSRDDQSIICSAEPSDNTAIITSQGKILALGDPEISSEDKSVLEIWKINIRTGTRERMVYHPLWLWLPFMSPNGRKLIFSVPATSAGSALWTREGRSWSKFEMRTDGQYADVHPVWSPDGKKIIFGSNRPLLKEKEELNETK
ncbi:MAG: TolB family protein [Candidatus Omnitrophota bacterium]